MKRLFALLLLLVAACSSSNEDGPVTVSVIGTTPAIADPNLAPIGFSAATLLSATAQGLVRFDASGQIEPGLAIRWDVSNDGLYYTFRIADGLPVNAGEAAQRLRIALGRTSRNPLKPVLGAIGEVVAVTPQVIEIRMIAPRPNLLQLFAQPTLAIFGRDGGTGPMRLAGHQGKLLVLEPIPTPGLEEEDAEAMRRAGRVLLRGERSALAVARFAGGGSDLVLGGRYADLPIARAANLPPRQLRFDPAAGLFGLAIVDTSGFLGSAEGRRALSMTVDRQRLATLLAAPGWRAQMALVPAGISELPAPATPDWIDTDLAQRRILARQAVAAWSARIGAPPLLRVSLPSGPGSYLLFALLRANWGAIGVQLVQVPWRATADLRLVDEVASADIATWYLRHFECGRSAVCSGDADAALVLARSTPSLADRAARLRDADARLAEITPFIPFGPPIRWSLVSLRVPAWHENPRGVHPLYHLRDDR